MAITDSGIPSILTSRRAPPSEPTALEWQLCSQLARVHGRTFYFASLFLPPARRRAVQATYAYCRIADDIVDCAPVQQQGVARRELDAWEGQLEHPIHPVAVSFAWVRQQYGIPVQPAIDLLAGVRMDLTPTLYSTWDEVRNYAYHVAGTVGLLVAPILGCKDSAKLDDAIDLGIAMQLTNFIRDVGEDASMGRLYLPLEDLHRFGVSAEQLLAGEVSGDFQGLIQFEIDRARTLYRSSVSGIAALAVPAQFAVLASARMYASILDEVERRNYDVINQRAVVSHKRKVAKLPSVYADFFRMQIDRL